LSVDTTRDIIRRSKHLDPVAFEQLVNNYQSYGFSLAMRLMCDQTEADDIVQESFIRVWKNIQRFDEKQKFSTWFYKIVTNLCLDRLRALKRSRSHFSSTEKDLDNPMPADSLNVERLSSNKDLADIIRSLTSNLPLKQKVVFTLRDLQDLSVEEVCEITGMGKASIKANLHHARKRIRDLLAVQYNIRSVSS